MTTAIDSSTAAAASGAGSSSSSNAASSLTQNFNTFLTLLTTQLQNQDPLSPLDTNQFTQQLVSFSQVEQQINTNSNLQQLISLQSAGESISALPVVGQNIEYNSPTAPLTSGSANYLYSLPSDATATEINVADANGNIVFSQPGPTAAGNYIFNWNGQTNAGVQLPDGNYTLQVTATGANNTSITPTISSVGTVSAVGVTNGTAAFTVNGMSIPLSELVMVDPNLTATQSN